MRKTHRLQDVYGFPGFRTSSKLRKLPEDPEALVMPLRRRGTKMICGGCGAINRAIYDRKTTLVRDLPCGDTRIYLEVEIRRVKCCKCGKVRQEKLDWMSENPGYTKRFTFFYRAEVPGVDDNGSSQGDEAGLEDR